MRFFVALVVAITLALSIGGCSRQTSTSSVSILRVVQNLPGHNNVSVFWGPNLLDPNLNYRENTGYLQVQSGYEQFLVTTATGTRLLEPFFFLEPDQAYTVVPTGTGALETIFLRDDRTPPPAERIRFRFVNASQGSPSFDVYFAGPNQEIEDLVPVLSDVDFNDVSDYITFEASTYEIRLAYAGTKDVFLNTGLLLFFAGQVRTYALIESPGGGLPYTLLTIQDLN